MVQHFSTKPGTRASSFSREDQFSNKLGREFGKIYDPTKPFDEQLAKFLKSHGAIMNNIDLEEFLNSKEFRELPENDNEIAERQLQKEREEAERRRKEALMRALERR